MKTVSLPKKSDLHSLAFRTSLEIATGGVLTAMLIRWITL